MKRIAAMTLTLATYVSIASADPYPPAAPYSSSTEFTGYITVSGLPTQPWYEDEYGGAPIPEARTLYEFIIYTPDLGADSVCAKLQYRAYSQDWGWQPWVDAGNWAGKPGKRLQGVQFRFADVGGTSAPWSTKCGARWETYYAGYVQDTGYGPFVSNGETCGNTTIARRLQAIKLILRKKPGAVHP